jgi:hypothetical protein
MTRNLTGIHGIWPRQPLLYTDIYPTLQESGSVVKPMVMLCTISHDLLVWSSINANHIINFICDTLLFVNHDSELNLVLMQVPGNPVVSV